MIDWLITDTNWSTPNPPPMDWNHAWHTEQQNLYQQYSPYYWHCSTLVHTDYLTSSCKGIIPYIHPYRSRLGWWATWWPSWMYSVMLPLLRCLPSPHFSFSTLSTSHHPIHTMNYLMLPLLSDPLITVWSLSLTLALCTITNPYLSPIISLLIFPHVLFACLLTYQITHPSMPHLSPMYCWLI